ncbi:MAG: hypothetical protein U0271_23995 [Polyangiaceae bacterium]
MKRFAYIFVIAMAACGSDERGDRSARPPNRAAELAARMAGTYRIEALLEAEGTCERERAVTKTELAEPFLIVVPMPETPDLAARALSCATEADCKARVDGAATAEHIFFFQRAEGDALVGEAAFGGIHGARSECEHASAGVARMRVVGAGIELELREAVGTVAALGETCPTHRARRELGDKACNHLLVFRGHLLDSR